MYPVVVKFKENHHGFFYKETGIRPNIMVKLGEIKKYKGDDFIDEIEQYHFKIRSIKNGVEKNEEFMGVFAIDIIEAELNSSYNTLNGLKKFGEATVKEAELAFSESLDRTISIIKSLKHYTP